MVVKIFLRASLGPTTWIPFFSYTCRGEAQVREMEEKRQKHCPQNWQHHNSVSGEESIFISDIQFINPVERDSRGGKSVAVFITGRPLLPITSLALLLGGYPTPEPMGSSEAQHHCAKTPRLNWLTGRQVSTGSSFILDPQEYLWKPADCVFSWLTSFSGNLTDVHARKVLLRLSACLHQSEWLNT